MNATEIKKEMMHLALPLMTGFQSDLVYDFESVDRMKHGETSYFVVRRTGTHFTNDTARPEGYRPYAKAIFIICLENEGFSIHPESVFAQ